MTTTAISAAADTLTPDEVHDVKFTPVRYRREGYDQTEVDNFLDRVENQLRSNTEYADGLLKLLQDHGIMAPSAPEPGPTLTLGAEDPQATLTAPSAVLTAVPAAIDDPANIALPRVA